MSARPRVRRRACSCSAPWSWRSALLRGVRARPSGRARPSLLAIFIVLTVSLNLANGFTGRVHAGADRLHGAGRLHLGHPDPASSKQGGLPARPARLAGGRLARPDGRAGPGRLARGHAHRGAAGVAASRSLVGAVLMRLSGPFVAVATLGFLVIVRVVLINADTLTRGSRTFSDVTPLHRPVVGLGLGRA